MTDERFWDYRRLVPWIEIRTAKADVLELYDNEAAAALRARAGEDVAICKLATLYHPAVHKGDDLGDGRTAKEDLPAYFELRWRARR